MNVLKSSAQRKQEKGTPTKMIGGVPCIVRADGWRTHLRLIFSL
jgi:hypothetical protein